jgi:ABC-type transporter Mla MlaB component
MLRITRTNQTLKLEGQLREPWVAELLNACDGNANGRLDLASVTFVDDAGLALLRDLQARGWQIMAMSPFVAAMLQLETK